MEWRLTVEDRPHWSICCADRFSRAGGVTRVQLAEYPNQIAVMTGPEGEGPAATLIRAVRLVVVAQALRTSEGKGA